MSQVLHLAGQTFHIRRGEIANAFRYGVDYVLLDPETASGPALFSRNRRNLASVWDGDHGGPPGQGRSTHWVRDVLEAHQLPGSDRIELLAQPRVLGHVFNPVSFWLCRDAIDLLRVVIAEVSNTYGDRHSYLCHRDDLGPITAMDLIVAKKVFHVSPFQPIDGNYAFRFDVTPKRIGIVIDFSTRTGGVRATLYGRLKPLTSAGIAAMLVSRPLGSRRVLALIYWQALKLFWKRAKFRARPMPPDREVSR